MQGKLVQHGNEIALIIDRDLREQLSIDIDTQVNISTTENQLIVTVEPEDRQTRLARIVEEMDEQYGPVFKRLAE
jgi:antitoxin component of MazEF toxin-antitoxin module